LVPAKQRSLRLVPICDKTQALFFANSAQYIEAAVDVLDADGVRIGDGTSTRDRASETRREERWTSAPSASI
jgi:thiamine monophosphate synthase